MSLLSESMEPFVLMDKTRRDDGLGGFKTVWVPGPSFNAAATLDNSMEARRAEKEGVTSVYTITTIKAVTLGYGDVLLRGSDNQLFRVTSNGKDKRTPASASLDMRVVSAEAMESLPGE